MVEGEAARAATDTPPDAPVPAAEATMVDPGAALAAHAIAQDKRRHPFRRLHDRLHANPVTGLITKIVLTLVGGLVLLAGIVMIFTPGQGILAVILGLAILSLEYRWAARLLERAKARLDAARARARGVDPRVRRQRLVMATAATVVLVAAVVGYLVVYDWPGYAINSWDWVQDIHDVVPELPGM